MVSTGNHKFDSGNNRYDSREVVPALPTSAIFIFGGIYLTEGMQHAQMGGCLCEAAANRHSSKVRYFAPFQNEANAL